MSAAPRILFITKSPPWPTDIGGNQRANLLYRALAGSGSVDLVLVNEVSPGEEARLRMDFNLMGVFPLRPAGACGAWRVLRPMAPEWVDRIAHHARGARWMYRRDPMLHDWLTNQVAASKHSVIVGCPAEAVGRADVFASCPVVLDNHDLAASYYRSRLETGQPSGVSRRLLMRHLRHLYDVLPPLFRRCAEVFIDNDEDRCFPGLENARLLPNIPFPSHLPEVPFPDNADSREVLTIGAFSHRPNEEGVDFFVQQVWPEVKKRVPAARYRIVGTGIADAARDRWGAVPGVEVVGYAADLSGQYKSAAFTVVPVLWGAGTHIKLAESLACGRTSVVTPAAMRGYRHILRHDESLLVGDTPGALAGCCIQLLSDAGRRERLARNGSERIRNMLSFEAFCSIVRDTLEQVISADREKVSGVQDGQSK